MRQETEQPDAILEAANLMDEERRKEAIAVCYPDTPFQLDRSLVRALRIVVPEVKIVTEDNRSMVVLIPDTEPTFLNNLSKQIRLGTPEGIIAYTLSDAYRFWIPEFGWGLRIASEQLYQLAKHPDRNWPPEVVTFARMAAKRLYTDVVESGIHNIVNAFNEFIDDVETFPEQPLSYEGYLATLKQKIEEVLPQINGTES